MHFFVVLLILLLVVLLVGMALGGFYLSSSTSSKDLVNQIQFTRVSSTFTNGEPDGQLWTADNSILAKLSNLRTLLALTDWFRTTPVPSPDLPIYLTLPEAATSVKTFLAASIGITFPPGTNTLRGVLLTPTHMALKFAHDEQLSAIYFTGSNVTLGSPQEMGIIVIYSTD